MAVFLNAELKSTLRVVPRWVSVFPAHLHELPRREVSRPISYLCVDAVEVDEGIGGGKPVGVAIHAVADLRDQPPNDLLDAHDEVSWYSVWHVQLPLSGAGEVSVCVGACEYMKRWRQWVIVGDLGWGKCWGEQIGVLRPRYSDSWVVWIGVLSIKLKLEPVAEPVNE